MERCRDFITGLWRGVFGVDCARAWVLLRRRGSATKGIFGNRSEQHRIFGTWKMDRYSARGEQSPAASIGTVGRIGRDGLEGVDKEGWLERKLRHCVSSRLRRTRSRSGVSFGTLLGFALFALTFVARPANATFVNFDNCLSPGYINSNPQELQFTPLHVWATFNTTAASHGLNVTIYGNVSGLTTDQPYPLPDDPQWQNSSDTLGKIVDLSESNNKYSTLHSKVNVLSFTPWEARPSRFCNSTIHQDCPLGPVFYVNE